MDCISHDAHVTIEYRYLMELKKVKSYDERRLVQDSVDYMTQMVNKAGTLYQLEIPFEYYYGEGSLCDLVEEDGLDFNNYCRLPLRQISLELTTDEVIILKSQAFEDLEIEPLGQDQQNSEFSTEVQRFDLGPLLMMPDCYGDIKQIDLDIKYLKKTQDEYQKQLLSSDLRSLKTTTQDATELSFIIDVQRFNMEKISKIEKRRISPFNLQQ